MDKERAKFFILDDELHTEKIYKSKDIQKLLDMNNNRLTFIYAVIDTESGETLMNMDWNYCNEPIIMGRFIHADFFFSYKHGTEIVEL